MIHIWTAAEYKTAASVLQEAFSYITPTPHHRVHGVDEQSLLKPDAGEVCLVMGAKAYSLLQVAGIAPRNRKYESMRGTPIVAPSGGWYLTTFDPFMTEVRPDAQELINYDMRLAHRLSETGQIEPEFGDYAYAEDLSGFLAQVMDQYAQTQKPVEVALDLETLGLHPEGEGARIITLQVSMEPGEATVIYFDGNDNLSDTLYGQIDVLLNAAEIIIQGANLKFDLRWILRRWGIKCRNFTADTLLIGSILNENRSNSLKSHAAFFTNMGGYEGSLDTYDKGRMDLVPKDVLLRYAGADSDVTLRTARVFKKELSRGDKAPLRRLYRKLVHPVSRVFEKIEHNGVEVDLNEYERLGVEVADTIKELETGMLKMMPGRLKAKYVDDLSLTRPALMQDLFFTRYGFNLTPYEVTEKTNKPSTTKAHLMRYHDHPVAGPFIELYTKWTAAKKMEGTYIKGFLSHLRTDGKFHPTYMLFAGAMFEDDKDDSGTDTGRLSAKEPAFQTIPKKTYWAKKLRKCFPAPPGYVMLIVDFDQGELKVVACMADESNMLDAYRNNMDLHIKTGAQFGGMSYDEMLALEATNAELFAKLRQDAKPANFGLLYGQQAPGFREFARINYGVTMTMHEAEERREVFFDTYPALLDYHRDAIRYTQQHGYIESPLGRRRHLPLINSRRYDVRSRAERQAINAPVQSTLSDLCLLAILEIDRQVPEAIQIGMVHDANILYVPADKFDILAPKIVTLMSNLPVEEMFGWKHQIPFTASGEYGPNMAEVSKLKL